MSRAGSQLQRLLAFAKSESADGKGALAMLLVVTKKFQRENFPINAESYLTASGGQIAGVSGKAANRILQSHDIDFRLADEGGRTNRGNMGKFRAYVACLNQLHAEGLLDLQAAEAFWIGQVSTYLAAAPFKLKQDRSLSVQSLVQDLLSQAKKRQAHRRGATIVGTVMQHMIAAKLKCLLGGNAPVPHKASEADASRSTSGDFEIGDSVIHVTSAPGEGLIEKCRRNLLARKFPIIVTLPDSLQHAVSLAAQVDLQDRLEIWAFPQFIATNVHEWGRFDNAGSHKEIGRLIEAYNDVIDEVAEAPSFKIET